MTPAPPLWKRLARHVRDTGYRAATLAEQAFMQPDAPVFTHMLPGEVDNYVREIARVMAPGGTCVASYFLLNDETRAGISAGRSFMTFDVPHESGVCRLHSAAVPEAAVALDEAFVQQLHHACRLEVRDIRRGRWQSGASDDQDVLTAVRR